MTDQGPLFITIGALTINTRDIQAIDDAAGNHLTITSGGVGPDGVGRASFRLSGEEADALRLWRTWHSADLLVALRCSRGAHDYSRPDGRAWDSCRHCGHEDPERTEALHADGRKRRPPTGR